MLRVSTKTGEAYGASGKETRSWMNLSRNDIDVCRVDMLKYTLGREPTVRLAENEVAIGEMV